MTIVSQTYPWTIKLIRSAISHPSFNGDLDGFETGLCQNWHTIVEGKRSSVVLSKNME